MILGFSSCLDQERFDLFIVSCCTYLLRGQLSSLLLGAVRSEVAEGDLLV